MFIISIVTLITNITKVAFTYACFYGNEEGYSGKDEIEDGGAQLREGSRCPFSD